MDIAKRIARHDALEKAEAAGEVADSMDVRVELIRKMDAGELTLEQVQKTLRGLKCGAAKLGLKTRGDFF